VNQRRISQPAVLAALVLLAGALGGTLAPAPAWGQIKPRTVEELSSADERKSRSQRRLAEELARRHLGTPITGGEIRDLATLQRLLDGRWIPKQDVFSQQALGLAFGDVLVRNLDLHWVVVDDDYGRSRALRWKEEEALEFPVTMFSKRIAQGRPVEVHELYDEVADRMATIKARALPGRRGRLVLPPRPEKQAD
jgi:hypothetical protein